MSIMLCRLLAALMWTLLVLTIFESAKAVPIDNSVEWPGIISNEKTGVSIAQWTENSNMNPEELGSYLEGDIMITKSTERNGLANQDARWPGGIIPITVTGNFSKTHWNLIVTAMRRFETCTCIRFKWRENEPDYVDITSENTGCWSHVGRIGGNQTVNLEIPGCVTWLGTVIHEFMHTIGFLHEHTREDRNSYVYINFTNIQDGAENNFAILPGIDCGVGYDYGSVMHYSAYAFAKDKNVPVIVTINPRNAPIGQRKNFSKSDVIRINRKYNCPSSITNNESCCL